MRAIYGTHTKLLTTKRNAHARIGRPVSYLGLNDSSTRLYLSTRVPTPSRLGERS